MIMCNPSTILVRRDLCGLFLQIMFLAMAFALPIHFLCRLIFKRSPGEDLETSIVNGKQVTTYAHTPTKVLMSSIAVHT